MAVPQIPGCVNKVDVVGNQKMTFFNQG
jgi:hypothetical protein